MNHKGVVLREEKLALNIKSKMYEVREGDFILSGIDARNGAFGIVPKELDGAIVTNDFWYFDIDQSIVDKQFFLELTSTKWFDEICRKGSDGTTQRIRLQKNKFFNQEIYLPPIEEQDVFISRFKKNKQSNDELKSALTHQQTLLKKLRQQILQEAIEGKLTADWRAKNTPPLTRGGAEGGGVGGGVSTEISTEVKKLNNLPHLKTFRKSLRKNLTPAEAKLWTLLKGKQLKGRKFRRQHSVANYILDFYCPSEKLAIELDGEVHNNPQTAEYDRERDVFLAHTGIKVLRFENKLVFENPDGLLEYVGQAFNRPSDSSFSASDASANPFASNPSAPVGHLPLPGEEFSLNSPPVKGEYREAGRGFEPASELLKRIQAEKAQLIKDKKIKKQKPLPPISEDEKPFELPDGWVWCRLGEALNYLTDYHANGAYEKLKRNVRLLDKPDFAIMLRTTNFHHKSRHKYKYITKQAYEFLSKSKVYPGDLIMNKIADPGTVFFVDDRKQAMSLAMNLFLLRFSHSNIISQYVYTYLKSSYEYVVSFASGTATPTITKDAVRNLRFPLPPLAEQKAIVAKVEKLLTLCDQLESQITGNQRHAEQLMQAVLKEAFSQGE